MKTISNLISPDLTHTIGYTILHSFWQGILIALGLSLLLLFLQRQSAVVRYRAALGALLAQLLLSGLTFLYYYQSANTGGLNLENAQIKFSFLLPASHQTNNFLNLTQVSLFFQEQLPLIVSVWLLGLLVMLLRFVGGLIYLQRLRTYNNTPLPASWQQKLHKLSTQLNLSIAVSGAESALVKTPVVLGYFKPLILLPLGTLNNLPWNQVEAILAHELAHIRRHDYVINILQTVIEALFFYHPAIWWVSDFVRVERENCCDDQAIALCGNKVAYAQALTHLEEIKLQALGLALGLGGKDGSVLSRIKRLFHQPTVVKPTFREGFLAAALLFCCFMAISAAALANYNANKTKSTKAATIQVPSKKAPQPGNNPAPTYSLPDSIIKKKEVIMIQDKKGKLLSLTIDGKKVPDDQLAQYENLNLTDAVVGDPPLGNNTTLKEKIVIRKGENAVPEKKLQNGVKHPLPPAPPAKPAPPEKASPVKLSQEAPEPLYLLDGKPISKAQMNKIEPSTIQKIDVLKGSPAQKYGEAGKNGVVIITSKTGSSEATGPEKVSNTTTVVKEVQTTVNVTVNSNEPIEKKETTKKNSRDQEELANLVLRDLKQDNLYSDDKDYTLKITNSGMYINNIKQSEALFQKYRKYLPYPDKNVNSQTFEIKGRFREK